MKRRSYTGPGSAHRYRVRMPIFWWLHRWVHLRFILRELTSLAVAYTACMTIQFVRLTAQGPDHLAAFMRRLESPVCIALHCVALCFVLFHSVTWFNLAPRAMVVKLGRTRVPSAAILLGNYLGWIVMTALLFYLFVLE